MLVALVLWPECVEADTYDPCASDPCLKGETCREKHGGWVCLSPPFDQEKHTPCETTTECNFSSVCYQGTCVPAEVEVDEKRYRSFYSSANALAAIGVPLMALGMVTTGTAHLCGLAGGECEKSDRIAGNTGLGLEIAGYVAWSISIPMFYTAHRHVWWLLDRTIPKALKATTTASWVIFALTSIPVAVTSVISWSFLDVATVLPLAILSTALMGHAWNISHRLLDEAIAVPEAAKLLPIPYIAPVEKGAILGATLIF